MLYPVYALLFVDAGLSTAQISTLLAFWSVTALLLEVPTGALADLVSRPRLLAIGAMLRALGFGLWVFVPSYPIFLLGFLLWSVNSALASGTLQALVYEGLAAAGKTDRYTRLVGRAAAATTVGNLLATVSAAPLLAIGDYRLVGSLSVVACVAQAFVAWRWPEPPPDRPRAERAKDEEDDEARGLRAYIQTLRAGVGEVVRRPKLRRLVLLAGLLPGFVGFDEYLPLLSLDSGARREWIPLLLAVSVVAMLGAALFVHTRVAAYPAVPLALAALAIGVGAASQSVPGMVAIGLGIGAFHLTRLVLEAAVQHAVQGPARATITSVAGLLAEVSAITVFLGIGLGAEHVPMWILVVTDAVIIAIFATLIAVLRGTIRP